MIDVIRRTASGPRVRVQTPNTRRADALLAELRADRQSFLRPGALDLNYAEELVSDVRRSRDGEE